MTKRQVIDYILRFNSSAKPAFLAKFSQEDLDAYLQHLQLAEIPRVRLWKTINAEPEPMTNAPTVEPAEAANPSETREPMTEPAPVCVEPLTEPAPVCVEPLPEPVPVCAEPLPEPAPVCAEPLPEPAPVCVEEPPAPEPAPDPVAAYQPEPAEVTAPLPIVAATSSTMAETLQTSPTPANAMAGHAADGIDETFLF